MITIINKSIELAFEINQDGILNSNQSLHYHAKGKRVRELRQMSELLGGEIYEDHFDDPKEDDYIFDKFTVEAYIYSPTRRHFDPPNLYPSVKALIDGLTDAKWWEDDNHVFMEWMRFHHGGLSKDYDPEIEKRTWVIKLVVQGVERND